MDLKHLDDIKINFIVGIGRSGSTLLVSILNQHPNCISTPELHHFIRFYRKYKNISFVSESLVSDYKNYLELFFSYKVNPLIGPGNYTILDSLKVGEKITYSQLTKLIYLGMYGEKGITNDITVIVDKNPYYTLQLDKILKIFPDAKFIALARDYRGFLLSNIQSKKIGTFEKSTYYHALTWNLFMSKIIAFKNTHNDKIKIIKYEDLVANKEIVVKDMFNYIGLSYIEKVFDFHKTMEKKLSQLHASDKNYERMFNKITTLSNPINKNRVSDWETKLTKNQLKVCDIISIKYARILGYSPRSNYSGIDIYLIYLKCIPSYFKVKIFEWMKSPELHFYYHYKINK